MTVKGITMCLTNVVYVMHLALERSAWECCIWTFHTAGDVTCQKVWLFETLEGTVQMYTLPLMLRPLSGFQHNKSEEKERKRQLKSTSEKVENTASKYACGLNWHIFAPPWLYCVGFYSRVSHFDHWGIICKSGEDQQVVGVALANFSWQ